MKFLKWQQLSDMKGKIKIGTRSSQLALWQAEQVEKILEDNDYQTEIVPIKSEGDIDLHSPLYEMGSVGVFTRYLDAAVLSGKVDIAVHSMKDVPTILARGLKQAAVLKRGPVKDLLLYRKDKTFLDDRENPCLIATGSIRRKAQWLNRYPKSEVVGLRGNVNTRLKKLEESNWDGALFAAAGLERIHLRPEKSVELDWMLPAPAQGAIMVVCRENDSFCLDACSLMNDEETALCTAVERDFLKALMGGCATPISALAQIENGRMFFQGNVLSPDGKQKASIKKDASLDNASGLGTEAGNELMAGEGRQIVELLNQ